MALVLNTHYVSEILRQNPKTKNENFPLFSSNIFCSSLRLLCKMMIYLLFSTDRYYCFALISIRHYVLFHENVEIQTSILSYLFLFVILTTARYNFHFFLNLLKIEIIKLS